MGVVPCAAGATRVGVAAGPVAPVEAGATYAAAAAGASAVATAGCPSAVGLPQSTQMRDSVSFARPQKAQVGTWGLQAG